MKSCAARRPQRVAWLSSRGFTLLEVLVGMALMGMCVAVLLSLVADNLRLTRKLKGRNKELFLAINKTEEAYLGILGDEFEKVGNKKVWRGLSKNGVPWKVVEETSKESKEILLYNINLVGLKLQGVRIQRQDSSAPPES